MSAPATISGATVHVQTQQRIFLTELQDGRVNYGPKIASLLNYFLGKLWNGMPLYFLIYFFLINTDHWLYKLLHLHGPK